MDEREMIRIEGLNVSFIQQAGSQGSNQKGLDIIFKPSDLDGVSPLLQIICNSFILFFIWMNY